MKMKNIDAYQNIWGGAGLSHDSYDVANRQMGMKTLPSGNF